ncbi:MAG: MBL fold metallo-hydrolase [Beijerinckiaceae bacterium]
MKVTFVGSGDAFGTGGRGNTSIRLDSHGHAISVDFGATALLGWNRLGLSTDDIDAVVLTHLHGDHFGGLPFLLLEAQFVSGRRKPLTIAGPPGTRTRIEMACEVFFPGMTANRWNYPWTVEEVQPGGSLDLGAFTLKTFEMRHPSGAPATGVQVGDGEKTFAYTGDTAWIDAVYDLADGVDLFVTECYSGERSIPNHVDWPTLRRNLSSLKAGRIAVTHLGRSALACVKDMAAEGLIVAEDGKTVDV